MSPIGQIIWKHLHSARLTGNEDCTTREAMNAVEAAAREISEKVKNENPIISVWGDDRPFAIFLSDGRKINVGRDERTSGPAWLEIKESTKVFIPPPIGSEPVAAA